jgi:hypothetical protein
MYGKETDCKDSGFLLKTILFVTNLCFQTDFFYFLKSVYRFLFLFVLIFAYLYSVAPRYGARPFSRDKQTAKPASYLVCRTNNCNTLLSIR